MMTGWRGAGYGWDVLELWLVGYIYPVENIATFCAGSDAACFSDTAGVFASFPGVTDDIFTIDQTGMVVCKMNAGAQPLTTDANRAILNDCVVALLP